MSAAKDLSSLIREHQARIAIVGLGYVGLPLALTFAEKRFRVLGFDVDVTKKAAINGGESYIGHIPGERISRLVRDARLEATSDFSRLSVADAVIVCVPTPLDNDRQPDLSFVVSTTEELANSLRPGQLIILESTTYPGTTEEVIRPILERNGLRCGRDFFLAYSPEREDPGNPHFETRTIPKVVGGCDIASTDLACELYQQAGIETVRVSSPNIAEASKLTENIFRAVNIALVNELKMVYDSMGIDVWEVLEAASTKPFGFMRFDPGPGWGGHCIPIDPFYLSWKAAQHDAEARFIELAGEVNTLMPRWVVGKLEEALERRSRSIADSKILVLGLAYKPDIADPRESPAFEVLSLLSAKGARVGYHDPHIASAPKMRSWSALEPMESVPLTPATLEEQAAVVVVTDHSSVDYDLVRRHSSLIVDARGVYRDRPDPERIISA